MFVIFLCSGCTIGGENSAENRNKHKVCTDTTDRESFSFYSNGITNVRIGIGADSSFQIIDDNGVKRTLSSGMDLFLKCVDDT